MVNITTDLLALKLAKVREGLLLMPFGGLKPGEFWNY